MIGHIIYEFYWPKDAKHDLKINISNKNNWKHIVWDTMLYGLIMVLVNLLVPVIKAFYLAILLSVLHLYICYFITPYFSNRIIHKEEKERNQFVIYHILHIVIMGVISYVAVLNHWLVNETIIDKYLTVIELNKTTLILWVFMLLIIHNPINVMIQKFIHLHKPTEEDTGKNAGRFIGSLERFIMILFLSANQYQALGLVMTAKSISRYDKISKNAAFAEYYLLGTLMSTLTVVVVWLIQK